MADLENWQAVWLTGLLILWAALLFGGFVFGKVDETREGRMPRWTQIGSSIVLVVVGWSWAVFIRDTTAATYALLVAGGMTLGFIGDLFMAELIPFGERVIGGIACFGLGHILYIAAFVGLAGSAHLDSNAIRVFSLIFWWLVGLAPWYMLLFRGQQRTLIHWIALGYTLLLSSTAAFGWVLALQDVRFVPTAVGAALFLLSDVILAAKLFAGRRFYLIDDVVWLTYGPAQCLIVFSIYAAVLRFMQQMR